MKIVWRKKASDDLEAIYNYILLYSSQNAVMVFTEIHALVNSFTTFPEKYPIDRMINNPNVRFTTIWNYKIVYSIEDTAIVVLRVFSTRQHPKKFKP